MALINCGINLILNWSTNCIISRATSNEDATFAITETKPYVPVVEILSTDSKRTIN